MKTPKRKLTMFNNANYKFEIILIAFICMVGVASRNHAQPTNSQEQINVSK